MSYTGSQIMQKVKELGLPENEYFVAGSASLAVRGIREARDLDIVVLPEVFKRLSAEGWEFDHEYERKWNRKRLKRNDIELYPDFFLENKALYLNVKELVESADIIEGIRFQSLESLLVCKLDSGKEKDLRDVELINNYLLKNSESGPNALSDK